MKTLRPFLATCVSLLAASAVFGGKDSLVTTVHSKASHGYHRATMPDGSFKREYYALTKGVYVPGIAPDRSIDAVRYPQIAKLVAQFLALQDYYPAPDAKSADLLLAITWGTTVPFNDSAYRAGTDSFYSAANTLAVANQSPRLTAPGKQSLSVEGIQSPESTVRDAAEDAFAGQLFQMVMFEDARREANQRNARLLGYVDEINRRENPSKFAGAGDAYHDLIADLENERYYVIVAAYDFRSAARGEKPKLLWSTRVSVQAQGNRFNETLAAMLNRASQYFGRDSHRLVRQYEPNAKVTLGELQLVGYEPPSGAEEAR